MDLISFNWGSRDSVKQRKGRTGRVLSGKCIRIIPKDLFKNLQRNRDPESLKMLPTELVYRLKSRLNSGVISVTKKLPSVFFA